jgi:putative Mg2+ transporter-C (MgtC) family protein
MDSTLAFADTLARLAAATAAGMVIGLDRAWRGKPAGIRTLALVSLGAALTCVATVHLTALREQPDAVSRAVQGVIQGVLAGIGFLGAGVVLRRPEEGDIDGLTTAAAVWIAAALGIACGLGAWVVALVGVTLALLVLVLLSPLDRLIDAWRARRKGAGDGGPATR